MKQLLGYARWASLCFAVLWFIGCAPSKYVAIPPQVSSVQYEITQSGLTTATLIDERREVDKSFHVGLLKARLFIGEEPIDPVSFLKVHTKKELKARGVDFSFSSENPKFTIALKKFRMRNHRASGFHPYVTATILSADVTTQEGTQQVAAYVRMGTVPVWSFQEVVEPCYNIPLSIVVKEFASKISRIVFNYKAPDTKVQQLTDSITKQYNPKSYLEVFELGFTNNPKAIPLIVKLTTHESELVRWAAISSLGTLNAVEQLAYLQEIVHANSRGPVEKGYALKSIGDLGTPTAREFLRQTMLSLEADTSHIEKSFTRDIVELYF